MKRPEWLRDPKYVTPFQLAMTIYLWSRMTKISDNSEWQYFCPLFAWMIAGVMDLIFDLVRLWWEGRKAIRVNPEKSC